jgi:hypothetical protein
VTAPAQTPAPDAMAGFADPSAVGGTRPAMRDLVGRVVVIRPNRYEPTAPGVTPGSTQERITADIMVVTGGPLQFGGNPGRGKPNTLQAPAPYFATGVYISNTNIVAACKEFVGKSVVLGRVAVGITNTPGNNPPFNLLKVTPAEPEYGQAVGLWTQYLNGQFLNPVPVSIGAAPVQAPAQSFGQLAEQINAAHTQVMAGGAVPAAPTVDPQAAFLAFQAEQARLAAASAPVAAAPADETIAQRPSTWQADVWAGLSRDQRLQVLAAKPF